MKRERLDGCLPFVVLPLALMPFALLSAGALTGCPSTQPPVCSLSSIQMHDAHRDTLKEVSRSGKCDAYTTLAECPEAQSANANWAKLWSQWESCR